MRLGPEFIELTRIDGLAVDLKYASIDNFLNENVYGDFNVAYLHQIAFDKLAEADRFLKRSRRDVNFLIYDALRPRSAQRVLFSKVEGTPQEKYVANPDRGSLHNFGLAVDLTLIDNGGVLEMGTEFDEFSPRSEPAREAEFIADGSLTEIQIANRHLLRDAMIAGGFKPIPHEWWHFNAMTLAEAKERLKIVE